VKERAHNIDRWSNRIESFGDVRQTPGGCRNHGRIMMRLYQGIHEWRNGDGGLCIHDRLHECDRSTNRYRPRIATRRFEIGEIPVEGNGVWIKPDDQSEQGQPDIDIVRHLPIGIPLTEPG
jgi:hypothetical protein